MQPDIIFFTGDLVDGSTTDYTTAVDFIENLSTIAPTYVIYGNHEYYIDNLDLLTKLLQTTPVTLLRNQSSIIDIADTPINIVGTDEHILQDKDFHYIEDNHINILLSHYPENYDNHINYSQYDFDLILSGHTHGGQWRLPFIGGLFAPGQGINPTYDKGIYNDRFIVNAGLGNSVFPLRLFNYPEIGVITIKPNTN